jgi:hypothetical protein
VGDTVRCLIRLGCALTPDPLSLLVHHDQLKCILRNLEVIESRSTAIQFGERFGGQYRMIEQRSLWGIDQDR